MCEIDYGGVLHYSKGSVKKKHNYNVPFYADKIEAALSAQNEYHAQKSVKGSATKQAGKSESKIGRLLLLALPLLLILVVLLIAPKQGMMVFGGLTLLGLLALLGSALKPKND